jgi:hypothetical protein
LGIMSMKNLATLALMRGNERERKEKNAL